MIRITNDDLMVIFDQWPKLHLGLDALSNQKILKGIYYLYIYRRFFTTCFVLHPARNLLLLIRSTVISTDKNILTIRVEAIWRRRSLTSGTLTREFWPRNFCCQLAFDAEALCSMTSLLTHTVAHSTRHSFRPKTNNQPLKKFLSLAVSCQKLQNSDIQS